jgi:hypothetical protein
MKRQSLMYIRQRKHALSLSEVVHTLRSNRPVMIFANRIMTDLGLAQTWCFQKEYYLRQPIIHIGSSGAIRLHPNVKQHLAFCAPAVNDCCEFIKAHWTTFLFASFLHKRIDNVHTCRTVFGFLWASSQ